MQCVAKDDGILYCTDIQSLSLQSLHELTTQAEEYERSVTPQLRLIDFTDCEEVNLNFNKLIAYSARRQQKTVSGKTALICTTPITFGVARMWQSIMDDSVVEISIFESQDEARAWLLA